MIEAAGTRRTAPGIDAEGTAAVLREMGAAEDQVQRYLASRLAMEPVETEPFGIWPGNETALDLFLALNGSWRCRGMSGLPMGLDESAIFARMQVMQMPHDLDLFDDVVAMGREAASALVDKYHT